MIRGEVEGYSLIPINVNLSQEKNVPKQMWPDRSSPPVSITPSPKSGIAPASPENLLPQGSCHPTLLGSESPVVVPSLHCSPPHPTKNSKIGKVYHVLWKSRAKKFVVLWWWCWEFLIKKQTKPHKSLLVTLQLWLG